VSTGEVIIVSCFGAMTVSVLMLRWQNRRGRHAWDDRRGQEDFPWDEDPAMWPRVRAGPH